MKEKKRYKMFGVVVAIMKNNESVVLCGESVSDEMSDYFSTRAQYCSLR